MLDPLGKARGLGISEYVSRPCSERGDPGDAQCGRGGHSAAPRNVSGHHGVEATGEPQGILCDRHGPDHRSTPALRRRQVGIEVEGMALIEIQRPDVHRAVRPGTEPHDGEPVHTRRKGEPLDVVGVLADDVDPTGRETDPRGSAWGAASARADRAHCLAVPTRTQPRSRRTSSAHATSSGVFRPTSSRQSSMDRASTPSNPMISITSVR